MRRTFCYLRGSDEERFQQQDAILDFFNRDGRDHRTATWQEDKARYSRHDPFDEREGGRAICERLRSNDEIVIQDFDRLEINAHKLVSTLVKLAKAGVTLTVVGDHDNATSYDLDEAMIGMFKRAMDHYATL